MTIGSGSMSITRRIFRRVSRSMFLSQEQKVKLLEQLKGSSIFWRKTRDSYNMASSVLKLLISEYNCVVWFYIIDVSFSEGFRSLI